MVAASDRGHHPGRHPRGVGALASAGARSAERAPRCLRAPSPFSFVAWNGWPMTPVSVQALMPKSEQVATIGCAVVGGVPTVAHIVRVRGEQDRRFESAGMHVVMAVASDACGGTGFGPVFAAGSPTRSGPVTAFPPLDHESAAYPCRPTPLDQSLVTMSRVIVSPSGEWPAACSSIQTGPSTPSLGYHWFLQCPSPSSVCRSARGRRSRNRPAYRASLMGTG